MNFKGKNIVVTGGAGAIGSNLVKRLSKEGATVNVIDDLSSGFEKNISDIWNVNLYKGSIVGDYSLAMTFSEDIDIVFHLAALFANQNSVDHPALDLSINGLGTLRLLQKAKARKVKRFIYISSSCVYGSKGNTLDTPYAITKSLGEKYTTYFNKQFNLDTVILRLFNNYGVNEYPGEYRNVIPNFMKLALGGKPLPITGTGKETRDFTYVEDTVEAICRAALKNEALGQTIDIGTGKETRIMDLAQKINKLTNNSAGYEVKEARDWDKITTRVASTARMKELLEYTPQTKLNEGLKKTLAWFKREGIQ